jgi:hypothetical protein
MDDKKFTIQDMRNAFIAGEEFQSDYMMHEIEEVQEVTKPDFGDWMKEAYEIDIK